MTTTVLGKHVIAKVTQKRLRDFKTILRQLFAKPCVLFTSIPEPHTRNQFSKTTKICSFFL